jgi:uncharacterized protein
MQKVLSIDGGGIRGILPAMILAEIERRTRKLTSELFDLVAGTSTGGILALGLTKPGQNGKPKYSAKKLIEAMGRALSVVTATDVSGFFGHCGYRAMAQLL